MIKYSLLFLSMVAGLTACSTLSTQSKFDKPDNLLFNNK